MIIKNLLFTESSSNNPVDLPCKLNFQPDEAIIRQITFASSAATQGVLLLYSSLTNDYIGAFHNRALGVVTYPNMRIPIKNGVPNSLQFWISIAGSQSPIIGLSGQWAVQIDFIKY